MTPPEFLRDWSYAAAGRVPMSPADALAEAWDEGYTAAYSMAKSYGHVDWWEGEPVNPYRMPDEGDYDDA